MIQAIEFNKTIASLSLLLMRTSIIYYGYLLHNQNEKAPKETLVWLELVITLDVNTVVRSLVLTHKDLVQTVKPAKATMY